MDRNRGLHPISTPPEKPVQPQAIRPSARVGEIVQKLGQIWPEEPYPAAYFYHHLVHGKPVILKEEEGEELAHLEADWIMYESDRYLDDPHETDWPFPAMYLSRVFFSYFVDPLWPVERIRLEFDKMDAFLRTYVEKGEDPTEYTTCSPKNHPELYGIFVLVHTRPGEGDPAVLSKLYVPWRQVVRERMLDKYSYFPRVVVIPFGTPAPNDRVPASYRLCL